MNKKKASTIHRNAEFYQLYEQSLEELLQKCPPEVSITATEVVDYMISNKKMQIYFNRRSVIQCVRDHIKTRSIDHIIGEAKRLFLQANNMKDNSEGIKLIERKLVNLADLNPSIDELQSIAQDAKSLTKKMEIA